MNLKEMEVGDNLDNMVENAHVLVESKHVKEFVVVLLVE